MEEAKGEVPPVEKKGKGRMVGILVALVLVLSAGAAGAVFAPKLLSKSPAAPDKNAAEAQEESDGEAGEATEEEHGAEGHEEEEKAANPPPSSGPYKQRAGTAGGEVVELNAIVVDTLANDGSVRHIKVVLAVELPKTMKADEFKRLVPFAREAAISYLRTRPFEQLSEPKNFDALRKELAAEIIDVVGKKHARRVLITDYVVQ
jgi:flagellar basal body-associated protein FliL